MEIRKVKMEDADNYLKMVLKLDGETKFMMFEEGERKNDSSRVKGLIKQSIDGGNLFLVATEGEEIVGFLSVLKGMVNRVRHSAYIVIGIRKKFRGLGIGSKLFLELDQWAKENDITRIELSVICSNIVAKKLYENNGFKVEGIKKNSMYIDGKYVDEFYMAKLYNN